MRLLAIDPGPVKSGWVLMDGKKPCEWGWDENTAVAVRIKLWLLLDTTTVEDSVVIEDVSHMGMAVGKDVFETVRWSGRFDPDCTATFIDRRDVKLTLCGNSRAKDPHIRQAIIDYYGGDSVAIGGKKCRACDGRGDHKRLGTRGRKDVPEERVGCDACMESRPYDASPVGVKGTGYQTPPGPLHGVSGHIWSALAVALTYLEQNGA